ncbi:MAG: elongation factor G [candidate division Zixibacteria bacterium SM23_73_3]|nr:MAG: elongation factor G [candidate division Zixibacteria bacterium SM23_73_3]
MKDFKIDQIRNVGVVSHGGVGKTSLVEAMLYDAKVTTRLGKVDDGTSLSDYTDDEMERKISIGASLLHLEWKNHKINIVDLPGYQDFIGEVVGGLRVTETALILLSAQSGVEVGTEQVWNIAEGYKLARIFFINRMDKEHANFEDVLRQTKESFGQKVVPIQIPIGEGPKFKGIVDLIKMKALYFDKDGKSQEEKIPSELEAKAKEYQEKVIEAVAETDDALLETFFDKGELSDDEIKQGLRKGIAERSIFPLVCGSASENIGVTDLLDLLATYLPAPSDFFQVQGRVPGTEKEKTIKISPDQSLCAFAFKVVSEPHVGELTFLKVYSGKLQSGMEVYNSTRESSERIGQIYALNGRERREIGIVNAGDVAAVVKLKNTKTGDTFCDKKDPILLSPIEFPTPVINMGIRPQKRGDEEKIANGFAKLHEEDPTFIMEVDADIKQTIIYGQGELHLEIMVDRLKRRFGVEVELEKPRIPYRETVATMVEAQGKYKRQSGGRGQYGDVWIRLEPLPRGEGFEFVNKIVGGAIPSKYIPSVEKGIVGAMMEGVLAGYRVVDAKVTLYDGTFHEVDSSDLAFKIAGSMGFKNAATKAKPVMLEPIYNLEVIVPEDFMGDVMGDLSSRRGKILGMDREGNFQKIKAQAPLAELYKYSTSLRSLTQGRGLHTREFSHYEEMPRDIAQKIIQEAQQAKEEEK